MLKKQCLEILSSYLHEVLGCPFGLWSQARSRDWSTPLVQRDHPCVLTSFMRRTTNYTSEICSMCLPTHVPPLSSLSSPYLTLPFSLTPPFLPPLYVCVCILFTLCNSWSKQIRIKQKNIKFIQCSSWEWEHHWVKSGACFAVVYKFWLQLYIAACWLLSASGYLSFTYDYHG